MAEKPLHHVQVGSVEGAVWRNERKDGDGVFYGATYKKRFREGGEWKETNSFTGQGDNAALEAAAREVKLFIREQMELDKEREPEKEEEKEKGKGRSRSAA